MGVFNINESTYTPGGSGVSMGQVWPIGSIFLSGIATDPATLLGMGTWSLISQGQVLVGYKSGDADFGNLGATPGAKTATPSAHAGAAVTRGVSGVATVGEATHTHTQGNTGGEATHTHAAGTLAGPSHTHDAHTTTSAKFGSSTGAPVTGPATHAATGSTGAVTGSTAAGASHAHTNPTTSAGASHSHGITEPNAGAGHDHGITQPNNHAALSVIQPSLVVYIWQRIA